MRKLKQVKVHVKPRCAWCGRRFTPYPQEPEEMQLEDCKQLCKTCLEWAMASRPQRIWVASPENDILDKPNRLMQCMRRVQ